MRRLTATQTHPLHDSAATRHLERTTAAALPAHTLMQRAGLAVAQLAQALAPHARTIWIACGPGNNGGDGLQAALHLQRPGRQVVITFTGQPERLPADARASYERARNAGSGLQWSDSAPPLGPDDLCIDALLGLGLSATSPSAPTANAAPPRLPDAHLQACLRALQHSPAPVLAVDLPSGLDADTGQWAPGFALQPSHTPSPRHTLSLLSLKPGLFTGAGRDAAGHIWWDTLGADLAIAAPTGWLSGPSSAATTGAAAARAHNSHKGSYGDVAVIGGESLALRGMGMGGAALLAASAALHSGAGRVMVCLLGTHPGALEWDPQQPELMFRTVEALALGPETATAQQQPTVVCGCGGGQAVAEVLPQVLAHAPRLVLDADALNAIAAPDAAHLIALLRARGQRGLPTVLTPHPLEAARLLRTSTGQVQSDRLAAAQQLATQLDCVVVLKGSGSVIAAPGQLPRVNPTGNARLATAGTGDVLAGMVGARLAAGADALSAATDAVYTHGLLADQWPLGRPLTASALARLM